MFPGELNIETFGAWRADPGQWLPVAIDIARGHSLPCGDPHVFATGTNLVVALDGKHVLKIFPPMRRDEFVAERASLLQLNGRLSVSIPEIVLQGEREQWPYLVVTRIAGVMGTDVWPTLTEEERCRTLRRVGEVIAEVQRIPPGELSQLEPHWEDFISKQIAGCRARHERLGLAQKYLDGIDEILHAASRVVPLHTPPVILTGEYTPENFLMVREANGWQLSGLIDFGDAMTGWREYDLLGPSTFMAGGVSRRIRELFSGFGYSAAEVNQALTRRLLVLLLLHRYSYPRRQIHIENWEQKAADLHELESLIWPL
jgi:hygromycin-B 7''-O-kinase